MAEHPIPYITVRPQMLENSLPRRFLVTPRPHHFSIAIGPVPVLNFLKLGHAPKRRLSAIIWKLMEQGLHHFRNPCSFPVNNRICTRAVSHRLD